MNPARDIFDRCLDHFHRGRFSQAETLIRAGLREFPRTAACGSFSGCSGNVRATSPALPRRWRRRASWCLSTRPSAVPWPTAMPGSAVPSWPGNSTGSWPATTLVPRPCCPRSPPAWGASGMTRPPSTSAASCRDGSRRGMRRSSAWPSTCGGSGTRWHRSSRSSPVPMTSPPKSSPIACSWPLCSLPQGSIRRRMSCSATSRRSRSGARAASDG